MNAGLLDSAPCFVLFQLVRFERIIEHCSERVKVIMRILWNFIASFLSIFWVGVERKGSRLWKLWKEKKSFSFMSLGWMLATLIIALKRDNVKIHLPIKIWHFNFNHRFLIEKIGFCTLFTVHMMSINAHMYIWVELEKERKIREWLNVCLLWQLYFLCSYDYWIPLNSHTQLHQ